MAEFKVITTSSDVPVGWRLATHEEVEGYKTKVVGLLGDMDEWVIAKLADGWKISGSGYNYQIQKCADPSEGMGHRVIINMNKSFKITKVEYGMPGGWRLATYWEVEDSMKDVTDLLDEWTIAKLQDGWQVVGGGYGNKLEKNDDPNKKFGDQVITLIRPVKDVRVVEIAKGITRDWSWATKSQVESVKGDVEKLLGEWSIAKLLDGWRIDGKGYGYKITKCDSVEGIGEMVIVQESL
nr:uncharacterized protein LOC129266155 [Lytechinus pictus]